MRHNEGKVLFTHFGQMDFISLPLGTAFPGVVSLLVIGRADVARGWRKTLGRAPAYNIIHAEEILHPYLSQDFCRRDLSEPLRSSRITERIKQCSSLLTNFFD